MRHEKLRELIIANEKTIKAFAEKVDIPYTTVHTYLKEDKRVGNMPIDVFIKIAHGLGMTAEELHKYLNK